MRLAEARVATRESAWMRDREGVLADAQQWPDKSPGRWWTKVAPIKGALRTRFFTPFEHDYEVREEDIKIVLP